jgi:hypothetical protein
MQAADTEMYARQRGCREGAARAAGEGPCGGKAAGIAGERESTQAADTRHHTHQTGFKEAAARAADILKGRS